MRRYDRAQAHTCSHRHCPFLAELAATARQAEAYDGALRRIEPVALILLQDGKLRHHVVLTALACQHRHPYHIQVPPSGFQTAAVMAVAGELIGIARATVGATFSRSDGPGSG